jgi:hypothetical protein
MGAPSAPQEDPNQQALEKQQMDTLNQQKKELQNRQLDFINRLQGQASTAAGAPSSGTPNAGSGSGSSNVAPFGISGLFTGSRTIG